MRDEIKLGEKILNPNEESDFIDLPARVWEEANKKDKLMSEAIQLWLNAYGSGAGSDAFDITGKFDFVLLDAPCSATGTIRRHPDLVYCKDGSDFSELIEIQAKLLDHASSLVDDNGLIIYVTCSLLPDEGECQIEEFLDRNNQFEIKKPNDKDKIIPEAWVLGSGDIRITPASSNEKDGLDGFYICYLQKKPNKT